MPMPPYDELPSYDELPPYDELLYNLQILLQENSYLYPVLQPVINYLSQTREQYEELFLNNLYEDDW